jgi:uroporphyrinogen III methyltransferase/synthase
MTSDGAPGRVYLVGAGPGDPGLLTLRSRELIAEADVVLHDRLVPAEALSAARADAELCYVGKAGGGESVAQAEIEELMVRHALAGRTVVRLKGGDPFVFGRGGEEALRLLAAGIPFEVVPGVTAGVAAAAYAGIPVTHRGIASAVALVTGHEDPAKDEPGLDWHALASFPGTLVFYMGVRALPRIAARLIDAGRRPQEAAAVIEAGTTPAQRTVRGTLATIAELAREAQVGTPAVTLVGDVAALPVELSWFEGGERPLRGRTVAVTRARAQASELARRLRALGAAVVEAPAIRIEPIPGPAPDLAAYDLLCLTSPNGADALFARLRAAGADARALAHLAVAAIGPGTAEALSRHGIRADVIPERFLAEGLVEALDEHIARAGGPTPRRALVARASEARETLPEALRERGIEVDILPLYDTVAEPLSPAALAAATGADYLTFTSGSTVRFFCDALERAPSADAAARDGGEAPARAALPRAVSIGPLTSAALRERGIEPEVEAARHDIDGLVEALVADARAAPPAPSASPAPPASPASRAPAAPPASPASPAR